MILKASQRGGARKLARHLTNEYDNDHVTVHEVRGFMATDVLGAFDEIDAISKGTKSTQPFLSLSLNPPMDGDAGIEDFEAAIEEAEEKIGLSGQPRVVIIHEKEGRRHAHVVWSRIDAEEMTAINMMYFKNKLCALSKELYLQHGWELPDGHKLNGWKDPLSFALDEWQQAKRLDFDPRELKQLFREAWFASDGQKAFAAAIKEHGYVLARGDRRGFVAVDLHGEVYSVARWTNLKTKDVNAKLGDPDYLPGVNNIKAELRTKITDRMKALLKSSLRKQNEEVMPILYERQHLIWWHRRERDYLQFRQDDRWQAESQERQARLRDGLAGLWDKLSGRYAAIRKKNEREAYKAMKRDRNQRERLFFAQIKERNEIAKRYWSIREAHMQDRAMLRRHLAEILARQEALHTKRQSRAGGRFVHQEPEAGNQGSSSARASPEARRIRRTRDPDKPRPKRRSSRRGRGNDPTP